MSDFVKCVVRLGVAGGCISVLISGASLSLALAWTHPDVTNKPLASAFVALVLIPAVERAYRLFVWAAPVERGQ